VRGLRTMVDNREPGGTVGGGVHGGWMGTRA